MKLKSRPAGRRCESVAVVRKQKRAAVEATDDAELDRASELGLTLKRFEQKGCAGTMRLQYGIFNGRWRLGDYWPTTGTLMIGGGLKTVKVETLMEAIEQVALAQRTTRKA